jgi:hypothetical protein
MTLQLLHFDFLFISVRGYLETHGEELSVLVARLEEADLVERLPLLVEKDVAALHLLVQNYGQRLSLYSTTPSSSSFSAVD